MAGSGSPHRRALLIQQATRKYSVSEVVFDSSNNNPKMFRNQSTHKRVQEASTEKTLNLVKKAGEDPGSGLGAWHRRDACGLTSSIGRFQPCYTAASGFVCRSTPSTALRALPQEICSSKPLWTEWRAGQMHSKLGPTFPPPQDTASRSVGLRHHC